MNENGEQTVTLRPVVEADLDVLFRQMSDPESVRMAAFTAEHPDDRQRFDAHVATVRESPDNTLLAIAWAGDVVGSIGCFVLDGKTEVTYWIDRAAWGRGIASQALALLLEHRPRRHQARPLRVRTRVPGPRRDRPRVLRVACVMGAMS